VLVQQNNSVMFNHGLFAGNIKNTNANGSPMPVGTIDGLSTMASATSAGFISPGSTNYNYHIRIDSPAKEQATGSTTPDDIDGQTRPYNGVYDFGADEYWPFVLSVVPGDGTLGLDWTAGASVLAGGVDHYGIIVTCPAGANPPQEGSCDQPITVGMATSFTLTGLSNSQIYTLTVKAFDSSGILIANSTTMNASPFESYSVYLPLIEK
jgi:hypothetical protein